MTLSTRLDAIAGFTYDPRSKRYRWKDGAGKGSFASKSAIINQTQQYVVNQSQSLVDIAQRLADGDINQSGAIREAAKTLKGIAVGQMLLGANGYENLTESDLGSLGAWLKKQYYAGKDEDGRRYGLRWLFREYGEGKISQAQLAARLKLYAGATKQPYWEAWSKRNGPYGVRVLGKTDNHCPECVAWAGMRPRLMSELPIPGCCKSCYGNCRCSLKPLTLEQAVQRGMKRPA